MKPSRLTPEGVAHRRTGTRPPNWSTYYLHFSDVASSCQLWFLKLTNGCVVLLVDHQAVELQPEILEKLPASPLREFLQTGIRLESQQHDQFHEIEVMQAVLQERYRGLSFPLPTLTE